MMKETGRFVVLERLCIMENDKKILSNEEKRREMRKKILFWKKAIFPDEYAVIHFISMSVFDPAIVIYLYLYVTGDVLNIPLTYFFGEIFVIIWFVREGIDRKKQWEEMAVDRTESIRRKIEELRAMEEDDRL